MENYMMLPAQPGFKMCRRCGSCVYSIELHDDWHVKLNRALATAGMFGTIGMGEV